MAHHADGGQEWDRHLLLLYRDEDRRRDCVASWVQRGLEQGEKVLYAQLPGDTSLLSALARRGVDVTQAAAEGRFSILPVDEFYPEQGQDGLVDRALEEGYPAVRLSAEATVALAFVGEAAHEVIERRMDELCRSRPVSAMCQYDARRSPAPAPPRALETHPDAVRDENVRLYREGGRVHVDGEVDVSSAALVEAYLEQVCRLEEPDSLTVDLSRLTFLDVEGCRALVVGTGWLRDAGGTLFLERARPHVLRTMTLLGVERQNHVFLV